MNKNYSLLDLKGLVMESYHSGQDPDAIPGGGVKDLVNTAGFGLVTFISKYYDTILDICQTPMNMIAVLEGGNQLRISKFPDYKGNRAIAKSKLDPIEVEQLDLALLLAKSFLMSQGVTLVGSKGAEGDDTIAYLVKYLPGITTVHTVDKDLTALCSETCGVFIRGKMVTELNDRVTLKKARADLVVPPSLVTVYKALCGDSSDHYGGVRGIGPAAWISLVEEFGHDGLQELDALIRDSDKTQIKALGTIGNKHFKNIANQYDTFRTMYDIASLHPEIVKPEWTCRVPDAKRVESVFQQAGCLDLLSKYVGDCFTATLVTEDNYAQCIAEITKLLSETQLVAWDYETTDTAKIPEFQQAVKGRQYVDMINSEIAGCSFSFGRNSNHVYYFSVGHKDTKNLNKSCVLNMIKTIENKGIQMVAQNIMFEATITKCQLDHTVKSWTDTKLFAHHIDENSENGLKSLSRAYLNYTQVSYQETLDSAGAADMSQISGEDVLGYGADDAVVTAHLLSLFVKITLLEGTYDFVQTYECPAVEVLVDSHIDGCKIDMVELEKQAAADDVTIIETMGTIRRILEDNCKEPNLKAAENLYADQRDYYKAKAKQLNGATVESVEGRVLDQKLKIKQHCFYEPLTTIPDCKDFVPTPGGFKAYMSALGLPEYEKVTKKFNDKYMAMCEYLELTEQQEYGLSLVRPAWNSFKKREGEHYTALEDHANKVIRKKAGTKTTGTELNMGSPNQNQYLFYLLLDLPVRLRTKVQAGSIRDTYSLTGSPSTDTDAIEAALANDCKDFPWKSECLQAIKDHKSAVTRRNIYWTPYPLWVKGDSRGMVHPGGSSCGTTTRRPTGSNPNLLQIAKGEVRRIFVPENSDSVIASIDFSSQELRLNADECKDPNWMSAYEGDVPRDLHAMTGCRVFKTLLDSQEEVKPEEYKSDERGFCDYDFFKKHQEDDTPLGKLLKEARSIGKNVNFSCQFGAQKGTLSRTLMCPEEVAEQYIHAYNETFSMLQPWKNKIIAEAKAKGYVTTAYGSRRHCAGINGSDRSLASRWERQVINFKIQGTAADLLKVVLTNLSRSKLLDATESFLISTVYDEILCEVPKANLKEFFEGICTLMSVTVPGGTIPMVPDCSFGKNWGDQIEVGLFPSQETIDKALEKLL